MEVLNLKDTIFLLEKLMIKINNKAVIL